MFQPPQIDYRENPSAGNGDGSAHVTREDPNAGGIVLGPILDHSYDSSDYVGDAAPLTDASQSAPAGVQP